MASNNIILAVPSANSEVNYELPQSESAQLSFSPEDIDGLKLDANGGLVISFVEGGNVTLSNFQSFIDNGNTLSLQDGTVVDPKLLFTALGGQPTAPLEGAEDIIRIGIPSDNEQAEYTLEQGEKYLFNFDLSETQGANVKDGKMVIDFANGGKIIINNYETAMASADAPELSLAAKTCIVSGDELITNIQNLAKTNVAEVVVEEEVETAARKSKIADADLESKEDIGANQATKLGYQAEEQVANIEPAAGEEADIAQQLAQIETAAGGAAGGRAGGYGFNSRPGSDPFVTNPDIGPLGRTQLRYKAPILEPNRFIPQDEPPVDGAPIAIKPDVKQIDETNLAGGPIAVSGNVDVDYGSDGFGDLVPNGTFIAGGSLTGGVLSHNGTPIDVNVVGDSYVGTAGGVTIFDLVIDPVTGNYTFTQYENIDHADGTDPNDAINLTFGVTATDSDNDAVSTVIQIIILDDVPTISGSSETIDETNLGPIVETGTLVNSFGEDGPGEITTTGSFDATGSVKDGVLSSGGVPVVISSNANGYTGTVNGQLAFTLTINAATGEYTYTQYKNLDHANPNDPNDIITLTFGAQIVDYDGDTATAPIIINIKDDAPTFQDGGPKPDSGYEIVDETNLGPVVETGTLNADFGGDLPGSYAFKDASFASSGSKLNGQLTHEGVPVVVTLVGNTYVGKAGDVTVFTLELNTSTGDYTFTLLDNFDHADATNPDDVITLDFGVFAIDGDGDQVEGSIRIDVKDDAPIANNDVNTYDTTFGVANGNVITGLNGGPGAADDISTDTDQTPQQNSVVKIGFEGNFVDVPAVGTVSINGDFGTLTISADGTYTYEAFPGGGMVTPGGEKEFANGPSLPDFDESEALDGVEQQSLGIAPGNLDVNAGDVITVEYVGEVAGYDNTLGVFTIDADGKLKAEKILIKSSDDATPGQTFSYTAGAGAVSTGFFLIADGANANNNYSGLNLETGSLNFVYKFGTPDARDALASDDGSFVSLVHTSATNVETVVSGPLYFTTDRGGVDNLNADGSVRVVSGIPDGDNTELRVGFEDLPGLGDKDFNDLIFDVSITTKDCGCKDPDVKDVFEYVIIDGDGDTDPATLTLNGKDLTDDKPILVAPAAEIVDETNLNGGVLTENGNILVDYGTDGPGEITVNGAFTSTGSKLNDQLTHKGVPVVVSIVGNTYVGTAGGVTVFTLKVTTAGAYEFKLFDNLDHKDGANPNDVIELNFGVCATDCDGDTANTHIVVKVVDDAPIAHNDVNTYDTTSGVATGNVVSGLNGGPGAADVLSTDANNKVVKIAFEGNEINVPSVGTVSIDGAYGKLTIASDGTYSYEAFATGGSGTSVEKTFISGPALPDFDESEALDGVEQQALGIAAGNLAVGKGDTVSVTYVGETAGYANTLGVFTVDANGVLRAEKILIKNSDQTVAGQTFSYTAGADAVSTGFFLVADGAGQNNNYNGLDLTGGTLNFVYKFGTPDARDAKVTDDGSFVTLVHSKDGVETVINGEAYFSSDRGGIETLNSDGDARVVSGIPNGDNTTLRVGFEDLPKDINDRDFNDMIFDVSIIDKDCGCNDGKIKDVFTYTLQDHDGDTDPATLTLNGKDMTDSTPIIIAPAAEHVDETYLNGGILTETGAISVNFGADAPGTVNGNGSFTSGGSKLNGQLSHNGVAIVVSQAGDMYIGKAGDLTIFTMQIKNDGTYTFKQFDNLDHADGSNPNDQIYLNFGVTATDCDGDTCDTTIKVVVKDDAPIANDDKNSLGQNGSANGNVITGQNGGANAADVLSTDAPNKVSKIAFGATVVDVPLVGNAVINGQFGKLTINSDGVYTYTLFDASKQLNGKFKDDFTYTLKDGDGDTDPAKLSLDFEGTYCPPIEVELCVNNNIDDICIKEDSSNNSVPLTASFAGGNGNEVMTLTLTGVASNWGFSAQGWASQGNGTYTITLPAGQTTYNGAFKFTPPANSDVDLSGLNVKASVYDPDTGKTVATNDGFNVNVDAVIDQLKFSASLTDHEWAFGSGKIFVDTNQNFVQHSKLTIKNLTHNDKDGSEALKEVVFTIADGADNTTYVSVKNDDGTFTKIGTKGTSGKDTTYTIDLSGMTYEQAETFLKTKIYLSNSGKSHLDGEYQLGIKIVSYEKNLSGQECDLTDNKTSYTVCLPIIFCISPLVMDMDGDGVELLAQENGVLFDMTNDGVKDKTGWADKDDALLALDKNGDGQINDRNELFGDNDLYGNGFDNLASYDSNNDGVIDANDEIFKDLKAWQDVNSDGVSQEGELKSLADVGIKAIKLNAAEVAYDIAGNPVTHESTIVREDGSETKVVDAWFAYEGGAGVDKGLTLTGTDGNDVLSGGAGNDDLYGGLGADTFLFQTISEGVDTLKDFNVAEGDSIDLSNVLSNFDAVTDAISDFVFATTTEEGNTILSVNTTGTSGGASTAFAVIEGAANMNVSDLFNNGSLVA